MARKARKATWRGACSFCYKHPPMGRGTVIFVLPHHYIASINKSLSNFTQWSCNYGGVSNISPKTTLMNSEVPRSLKPEYGRTKVYAGMWMCTVAPAVPFFWIVQATPSGPKTKISGSWFRVVQINQQQKEGAAKIVKEKHLDILSLSFQRYTTMEVVCLD
ncbi:hypothetical protein F5884DRAFT_756509 [Xylogone sp. PMI_703]|nr:hypothetical protein F5884DRAFT_756509 [Xylogone sp. PMI_703]